ncbi:MAG: MFS transporter [Cytophagales bacterium]|nr:MFS transporter [Cytophagales bacterium]
MSTYSKQFWLLCISSFLFFAGFNLIIAELPTFLENMGGGDYKGFIIGLFIITAGASRPFSGKLADTIGRIPVMIIGASVCAISGFIYPLTTSIWAFLGLRLFHGFSTGFKPTGTSAFIADIIPADRKGEALGMMSLFSSTGMALGPFLGSLVVQNYSYDVLFYSCSTLSILSVFVLLGMKETLPNPIPFKWSLLKIKKEDLFEKKVLHPIIITLLCLYTYGALLTLVPDYSLALGIENKGLFLMIFTISSLAIRFFAGKFSDKYGRIIMLKVSTMIIGLSFMGLVFSDNTMSFLVMAIPLGLGVGINNPSIIAWTMDLADPKYTGRAISTFYLALEIGIGLGAFVSGWIFQNNTENIPLCFGLASLLSFLAFILLFILNKKR